MNKKSNKNRKKLPFVIPKVCTYPYFTAILAILSAEGKEDIWLYNNFILIWMMKKKYYIDYWVDFKFGEEANQNEFCPMMNIKGITREEMHSIYNTLKNALKMIIDSNNYIMISVDVYYITNWWGKEKERHHFRHELCVHGYDYEKEVLIVSDFVEAKYTIFEVDFKQFEMGFYNYKKYTPYENYGEIIWLLSPAKDKEEKLDLNRIRNFMLDFLNSEDIHIKNHIQLERKEASYVFGLDIFKELQEYLEEVKTKKKYLIDIRPFHILLEMQKIMEWRFEYIYTKYGVCSSNNKMFDLIYKQYKNAGILQGLVVKYNITGQKKILDVLLNRLAVFAVDEKEMFEECIAVINEII